jgi:hypothetical protein
MQRNRCPIGDAITDLDAIAADRKMIESCERTTLNISSFGSALMRTSVFVAALILVGAYGAPADEPPSSATSPAQPVATMPKSQTPGGNMLQDEMNQQNKNNQQKQQYRNMQSAMKRQQTGLNKQIEKESSAAKNGVNPAVAQGETQKIGARHGAAKKKGKHGMQTTPTIPKTN